MCTVAVRAREERGQYRIRDVVLEVSPLTATLVWLRTDVQLN